jgi:hypothetical protein
MKSLGWLLSILVAAALLGGSRVFESEQPAWVPLAWNNEVPRSWDEVSYHRLSLPQRDLVVTLGKCLDGCGRRHGRGWSLEVRRLPTPFGVPIDLSWCGKERCLGGTVVLERQLGSVVTDFSEDSPWVRYRLSDSGCEFQVYQPDCSDTGLDFLEPGRFICLLGRTWQRWR